MILLLHLFFIVFQGSSDFLSTGLSAIYKHMAIAMNTMTITAVTAAAMTTHIAHLEIYKYIHEVIHTNTDAITQFMQ